MAISFSCSKCGMRFNVSDGLAGRRCRCKKCGQGLRIPAAQPTAEAVAATGMFRMGAVPVEQSESQQPTATDAGERSGSALSQSLQLVPIASLDNVAPVSEKASLSWEEEDAVEYELAAPVDAIQKPNQFRPTTKTLSNQKSAWARGGLLETSLLGLRKISDFAYVPSTFCLLLLLLAIVMKRHDLAIAATVGVLALNVVRFAMDGIVLLTLAFKPGVLAGVLFFIPPFTFYYLQKRGKPLKNALGRFLSPAIPVVAVVLLYIFVPWLRGAESPESMGPPTEVETSADRQQASQKETATDAQ